MQIVKRNCHNEMFVVVTKKAFLGYKGRFGIHDRSDSVMFQEITALKYGDVIDQYTLEAGECYVDGYYTPSPEERSDVADILGRKVKDIIVGCSYQEHENFKLKATHVVAVVKVSDYPLHNEDNPFAAAGEYQLLFGTRLPNGETIVKKVKDIDLSETNRVSAREWDNYCKTHL